MRVIVCGGRDYDNRQALYKNIDILHNAYKFTCVIHGAARGADTLAGDWAKSRNVEVVAVKADWELYGRSAGPIRNGQMLKLMPDAVIAFPGGNGTANMIEQALNAGVIVWRFKEIKQ